MVNRNNIYVNGYPTCMEHPFCRAWNAQTAPYLAVEVSVLRGKKYLLEKKEPWRPSKEKGVQNAHLKTRDKIAEETGVSAPTIIRDAQLAEAVEDLKEIPIEILKQNPIL